MRSHSTGVSTPWSNKNRLEVFPARYRPIILGCDPEKPEELGEVLPFPKPDITPPTIKLRGSRARAAHRMAMAQQHPKGNE